MKLSWFHKVLAVVGLLAYTKHYPIDNVFFHLEPLEANYVVARFEHFAICRASWGKHKLESNQSLNKAGHVNGRPV